MSKIKLLFRIGSGIIEAEARLGSRLANTIRKQGLASIDFSKCNYKLECGKCIVSNSNGILGEPNMEEERVLALKGAAENFRCSCQVIVNEEMENQVIDLV